MPPTADTDLASRLADVRVRIAAACARAGRAPADVTLVAVSKTHPAEAVRAAFGCGVQAFGENYVQEFRQKHSALADLRPAWHFIGHLQRNKVRQVVGAVALIHGVGERELLAEIARRSLLAGLVSSVLLQVNLSREPTKSGCAPEALDDLAAEAAGMQGIRLCGLMTMPAPAPDPEAARPVFAALRELREGLVRRGLCDGRSFRELSMGMSDDFEVAIAEGATLVRIGTLIFGARPPA